LTHLRAASIIHSAISHSNLSSLDYSTTRLVSERTCGFKSHPRHQMESPQSVDLNCQSLRAGFLLF